MRFPTPFVRSLTWLRVPGALRVRMASSFINIHGIPVPVFFDAATQHILPEQILSFGPFVQWANAVDKDMIIKACRIQSIDLFGTRIGFLKMKVEASVSSYPEAALPGIVFLRGGAVSVLLILACDGQDWVVCCRQPRVPIGRSHFLEVPAGMLDDAGHFAGVAAKELQEETGIMLGHGDLIDLTDAAMMSSAASAGQNSGLRGMYPSVGACDEFIRLYYARRYVTKAYLESLSGRLAGNAEENEIIMLELVPYDKLWAVCLDAKTLSSMLLRERLLAAGLLADPPQSPGNTLSPEDLPVIPPA